MRRLAFMVCAGLCMCAVAVVSTAERVIELFTEAIDSLLRVLPVEAPAFTFGGALVPAEGFGGFADPQVKRHEAGRITPGGGAPHLTV